MYVTSIVLNIFYSQLYMNGIEQQAMPIPALFLASVTSYMLQVTEQGSNSPLHVSA